MKVSRVFYNDDDILVRGHLIRRLFHRPVFFSFERKCGFDYQYITRKDTVLPLKDSVERRFYKTAYPVGTKIKVIRMFDPFPVPDGSICVVDMVDDDPQIHCTFENGRRIAIKPGFDIFRKLKEDNHAG